MNDRPLTVKLYVALAVATDLTWTIVRYDEVMARLPAAIASSVVGALVLWGVWRGHRAVWMLVVAMNGLALIYAAVGSVFVGPPLEMGLFFVVTAAKLGLLFHHETRAWTGSRPELSGAA